MTEENAPYPLAKTKMVLGKADRKTRKAFVLNDNCIPMYISRYRVNTPDGVVEIMTTEAERKILREKYKNHPHPPLPVDYLQLKKIYALENIR